MPCGLTASELEALGADELFGSSPGEGQGQHQEEWQQPFARQAAAAAPPAGPRPLRQQTQQRQLLEHAAVMAALQAPAGPGEVAQEPSTPLSADRSTSLHEELPTPPPVPATGISLPAHRPLRPGGGSRPAAQALRLSASTGADLAGRGSATISSAAVEPPSAAGGCSGCSTCSISDGSSSSFESINRVAAVAAREFATRRSGERERRRSEELRLRRAAAAGLAGHEQGQGWPANEPAGPPAGGRWEAEEAVLRASEWSPRPLAQLSAGSAAQRLAAASAPSLANMAASAAARAAAEQQGGGGSVAAWEAQLHQSL
ncbi:hypothetical protein ABPG75_002487 [Micractinium tetrahymenae]